MSEKGKAPESLHKGHRRRVKEEFRRKGLEHFPSHKILELLLFHASARGDVNPAAHRLMERFGSLSGVFDAPLELLMEVKGIGLESATLIKLVPALARAYLDDKTDSKTMLKSCPDIKRYVESKFLGEENERIFLICLGVNGKILDSCWLASGSRQAVELAPVQVARAVLRCGAVKAVLAHNHPDGFCNPSSRDLRATSVLFDELGRVGVELLDHIIVAPDGVYSMTENNMFPACRA